MYVLRALAFTPAAIIERGKGMTAFVEADRVEFGVPPGRVRALANVRRRERPRGARAEDEADVSPGPELVLDEMLAQGSRNRHRAPRGPALRADDTLFRVPRA